MQTISKMQNERYFAEMLDAKDVVRILAESVGKPTETAIEALIQSCNTDVYPMLWVTRREGTPVGIVRLDSLDRMRCIITHIAVHPDCRGQGIGRSWPRNPRTPARDRANHAQIKQSILADLGKCHRKTAGLFDPIRCDIRGGYNSHVEVFRKYVPWK